MEAIINSARISHISACIPQKFVDLNSLSEVYGEMEVKKIIKSTGISKIRCADDNICASDLCFHAANHIFRNSGIDKAEIDGLIFVSQTRDYILPATSIVLQERFKLSKETLCFDLPFGCSGYVYGCYLAALLVSMNNCKKVLVLSGDVSTRLINENDRSVRMVLGDAGTATIVEKGEDRVGVVMKCDGSGAEYLMVPAGGDRYLRNENSKVTRERENGNFRSDEDLYMDGLRIFQFALREVPPVIEETLRLMKWKKQEVGVYALHQINELVINYLRRSIGVHKENLPSAVAEYGNTGPASIPLMLCHESPRLKDKKLLDKTVMCGFGVGLSWGCLACDLSRTEFYYPIETNGQGDGTGHE